MSFKLQNIAVKSSRSLFLSSVLYHKNTIWLIIRNTDFFSRFYQGRCKYFMTSIYWNISIWTNKSTLLERYVICFKRQLFLCFTIVRTGITSRETILSMFFYLIFWLCNLPSRLPFHLFWENKKKIDGVLRFLKYNKLIRGGVLLFLELRLKSAGLCFRKYKKTFVFRKYKKSFFEREYRIFFNIRAKSFYFWEYRRAFFWKNRRKYKIFFLYFS